MRDPVSEYQVALADVYIHVRLITERLEAIAPTEADLHWGHVGSVKRVLTLLRVLADELGVE
jgi:hypothetical protein